MSVRFVEKEMRGAVGVLRLNDRPTRNAMSLQMVEELNRAIDRMSQSARAIVITGAGQAFCSGANLSDEPDDDFGRVLETHVNPLMDRLRSLPVPWIVAVRGAAAGVGCALALAADLVVAGESGYFLQAFSRIGLVPDGGSTHLLVRTIGRVRTMEMALLGGRIPAATALAWGMINRVVADEAVEDTAIELAERLAVGPQSLARIRAMVWQALDAPWDEMLGIERHEQSEAGRTRDCAEGIAAFREKRAARFTGA